MLSTCHPQGVKHGSRVHVLSPSVPTSGTARLLTLQADTDFYRIDTRETSHHDHTEHLHRLGADYPNRVMQSTVHCSSAKAYFTHAIHKSKQLVLAADLAAEFAPMVNGNTSKGATA